MLYYFPKDKNIKLWYSRYIPNLYTKNNNKISITFKNLIPISIKYDPNRESFLLNSDLLLIGRNSDNLILVNICHGETQIWKMNPKGQNCDFRFYSGLNKLIIQ